MTHILYTSAIAHALLSSTQAPLMVVAEQLAENLAQRLQQADIVLDLPLSLAAQSALKVQTLTNGLIQVELSDRAIALWLTDLLAAAPQFAPALSLTLPPKVVFAAQHSHARCCSLLRLLRTESLLPPQTQPQPLTWLDSAEALPLTSAARRLVCELFTAWEALIQSRSIPYRLLSLTQCFEQFHSVTQIFDRAERGQVEVNAGLLLATQRILGWWLICLGFSAPTQL